MNLQSNKPQMSSRAPLQNTYVTQCKVCRSGVFAHQLWHWSVNPIGIVHTACVVTS